MKQFLAIVLLACGLQFNADAQQVNNLPAVDIIDAQYRGTSVAVRDWDYTRSFSDERTKNEKLGYHPKGDWPLHESVDPSALPQGEDPAWQKEKPLHTISVAKAADVNYDGIGYTGVNPSDNILDVGPNHVIQMVNASSGAQFQIFDKSGTSLAGPLQFDNFFGFGSGLGDPIVLYDALADRWFMAEFTSGSNDFNIAVSQTADPLGSYHLYTFTADNFPDYLKFGVWTDMYIMTSNESGPSAVYALDRVSMLAGSLATMQRFTVPDYPTIGFQATTPVTFDVGNAPPAGAPGMFMRMADDAWSTAITNDRLEIWSMDIDFANSSNSVVTGPVLLNTDAFDTELCGYTSFSCFQQPGTSVQLDPLREVLMNRVQYKNLGTHEAIVCNHVTDVDGNDRGGVRWYELRRTGGIANAWGIHQQGTYSPDTDSRFMAGIAMNDLGDISLFYNVTSSSTFPGVRYTGRFANDPLGQMTIAEVSVVEGAGSNGSNRYGDYNSLDVDPADGISFWGTANYNPSSSWSTRIAGYAFSQLNCTAPTVSYDISEDCLNGTFSIQVTIENDGDATEYALTSFANDTTVQVGLSPGIYSVGPFAIGELVGLEIAHNEDPACNVSFGSLTSDGSSCCTAPTLDVTTVPDCESGVFDASVNIGSDGDASDYSVYVIEDGVETFIGSFLDGDVDLGEYPLGTTIDVRVEHTDFSYCDQTVSGITVSAVCNDECSGALPIACGDVVTGTTIGATVESPDPGTCGTTAGTGGGVWYRFTGQNSSNPSALSGTVGDEVQLSTCNDAGATPGSTDYDTKIRVFSGDCGNLSCVAGLDDADGCSAFSTLLTFETVVGTEYFVLVHGYQASEGNFDLSMTCTPPPACDEPSDLTAITQVDGALLTWFENGLSETWDLEFGAAGFAQGDGTVVPGIDETSYQLSGLESATSYDFYVRSNCPGGLDNSNWVFGSFTTTSDFCAGDVFTDPGGVDDFYDNDQLVIYQICPQNPSENVSITFDFVDIEVNVSGTGIQDGCWDFLTIYDGPDTSSPVLAQTLCGELEVSGQTPSDPNSLLQAGDVFTATNGCLTVVFESDAVVINQGWSATVDCGAEVVDCSAFDTAPVDLTKSFDPVDGVQDRVQVKWFKDTPQVRYTVEDNAACDIEYWAYRFRDDEFSPWVNIPPAERDTSRLPYTTVKKNNNKELFKWPLKFRLNNGTNQVLPNRGYRWRVRCYCDQGALIDGAQVISPWSEVRFFNTPDFDPETGIYTPPGDIVDGSADAKSGAGQDHLTIYPNPNDGESFTIQFGSELSGNGVLDVMDMRGRIIHSELVTVKNGQLSNVIRFDSALRTGIYHLMMDIDGEVYREKFVVD